jgi:hypothetical protein
MVKKGGDCIPTRRPTITAGCIASNLSLIDASSSKNSLYEKFFLLRYNAL